LPLNFRVPDPPRSRVGFFLRKVVAVKVQPDHVKIPKPANREIGGPRESVAPWLNDFADSRGDVLCGNAEGVDQFLGLARMRHFGHGDEPRFCRRRARGRECV